MKRCPKYTVKLVREGSSPYNFTEAISHTSMAAKVAAEITSKIQDSPTEVFSVIALDIKNKPIGTYDVSHGTLDGTLVSPRTVFLPALMMNAANIILIHNHPSGDPAPSRSDLEITKLLVAAGKTLGISVLDHVITYYDESSSEWRGSPIRENHSHLF